MTIAAVTQTFLPLTIGGEGEVDATVRSYLHLQTRIAKHLTEYRQENEAMLNSQLTL